MAKVQMYSLYDTKAQVFLKPLSFINESDAMRWFDHQINEGDKTTNNITAFPADYILFRLADQDDKTGMFCPRDEDKLKAQGKEITQAHLAPKELCVGASLIREKDKVYTVEQLLTMLDNRYSVVDIKKEA
jgi:hypothetical protein